MAEITLDIETLPSNDTRIMDSLRQSITAPGNYTKPESIQKWMDENADAEFDKLHRKTALDGLYGQILSIAWAIDDDEPQCLWRESYADSEAQLLESFFAVLEESTDGFGNRVGIHKWIGHYISGYDLRFIWQRCVINGVRPSISIPYDAKPWDNRTFDTKVAWTGSGQYSGAGSLDKLSSVLLGAGKGEIDGSKVYDYFLQGRIDEIVEYNKEDVRMARALYKRMNFINELVLA